VARVLQTEGKADGRAVVLGYPWVLEAYLPALAASDPQREAFPTPTEAGVLVVDPAMAKRSGYPSDVAAFLRQGTSGYHQVRAGRLTLYVRR
jgi:hypothetical protein